MSTQAAVLAMLLVGLAFLWGYWEGWSDRRGLARREAEARHLPTSPAPAVAREDRRSATGWTVPR